MVSTIQVFLMDLSGFMRLFMVSTVCSIILVMLMVPFQLLELKVGLIILTGMLQRLGDHISGMDKWLATSRNMLTISPLHQFMVLATWFHKTSVLKLII
jgi:hypothetical protein